MNSTDDSSDASPSDMELAISSVRQTAGLVGYRNVLSYANALGIKVFPKQSLNVDSWTKVGSGSYSTTYKTFLRAENDTTVDTAVAIKQPNRSFTRTDTDVENVLQHEALASIIQELRILAYARLKYHPNLPHVLGVFFQEEDNPPGIRPSIIFDLAKSDLQKHLMTNGTNKILPSDVTKLAADVANGIGALHTYNLVHGDVKPENILLFVRGGVLTAAIGDLGSCNSSSNASSIINGTTSYCAPEYLGGSPFAEYVNKPSRDVYNYGLLLWSMMTSCKWKPFPPEKQFDIQHNTDVAIRVLLESVPRDALIPNFREIMCQCLRSDPTERLDIFDISGFLDLDSNKKQVELQDITEAVEATLLEDPTNPRVKALSEMPLPAHLVGKLRHEYRNSSGESDAIRIAITLAGLYSGVVGPPISAPWNIVAKIQWLLKAVELGSHTAMHPIMMDRVSLKCVEDFGSALLKVRQQSFESPTIDLDALHRQLKEFAEMPDVDAANLLVFLGGNLDFDKFEKLLNEHPWSRDYEVGNGSEGDVESDINNNDDSDDNEDVNADNVSEMDDEGKEDGHGAPGHSFDHRFALSALAKLAPNRRADLELVDSDAYDFTFVGASPLTRSNYYNQLETFILLAEEQAMKPKSQEAHNQMAAAIFHGSLEIVRYLVHYYAINPNDCFQNMSYLNQSVLFRRPAIVKFFLEHGSSLDRASGDMPSSLHLVSRHDDPDLTEMLCEHLKRQGAIDAILESAPTEGPLMGWTSAYTAMACRSWKNLEVLLRYGADPNGTVPNDEAPDLIEYAVRPLSPAAPISILEILLQKGARLDRKSGYVGSPLMWAVRSGNVSAVALLVLHGAVVSDAAVKDAEENIDEDEKSQQKGMILPVYDEDGNMCERGWEEMRVASSLIAKLLKIGQQKQPNWKEVLKNGLKMSEQSWKGKMWVENAKPTNCLIEIHIPERA